MPKDLGLLPSREAYSARSADRDPSALPFRLSIHGAWVVTDARTERCYQCSKVFDTLASLGCEDCYYKSDYCPVILNLIGFEEVTDNLVGVYVKLVDKYSDKVDSVPIDR